MHFRLNINDVSIGSSIDNGVLDIEQLVFHYDAARRLAWAIAIV